MIREMKFPGDISVGFDDMGIMTVTVPTIPATGLESFLPDHLYAYVAEEVANGKFYMNFSQRARLCLWMGVWNSRGYKQGAFGLSARKIALVFHDALRKSVNRVDEE